MTPTAVPLPTHLGQPCWSTDAVERAISSIARMSPELEPYFLAAHAPIERLRDRAGAALSESDFYDRLFAHGRHNVFAVVRGDPGSGKSHLIRWLHLRCTQDIDAGRMSNVLPVLVQRRTGSLKDALTQIVEQLPAVYRRHLRQIEDAIGNLSPDRARHALAGAIQLQLVDRSDLPTTLRAVHELLLSPGSREWFIRSGSTIDRIVRQLTEESDIAQRELLPEFTPDEFRVPQRYLSNNAPKTLDLIEELEYLAEMRREAAALFNSVSRPAVKAMSGLIGTGLRDVFDAIRRELRAEGKRLVLLIEDVTVMASLDDDVLNAVEPNPDPLLCDLVAVVGMTQTGYSRLPENLTGRMTDVVQVGAETGTEWLRNPDQLARFSARYLNVARLSEDGTRAVAADRRAGGDVAHSACSGCPVRDTCHTTFGSVELDAAHVGLFPFTATALERLFGALDESVAGARKNPRGLLEHVLLPVLRDGGPALADGAFPRQKLAVQLEEPTYWSAFTAKYLGSWSSGEQARLRAFAQAWISASTPDGAAQLLEPYRQILGFREFSAGVASIERRPEAFSSHATPKREPTEDTQVTRQEPRELTGYRNTLAKWAEGGILDPDDAPRELLLGFLRRAIGWDDEVVPVRVYDKFLKNKAFVRIEDQKSRPRVGQHVALEIERSEESRRLLEALGRWKWQGSESWRFEGGQLHRRVAARWLRRHRPRVVTALRPPEGLGAEPAMEYAVRILGAVALLRRRTDLPPDRTGMLRELLRPLQGERPATLNPEDDRVVRKLWAAQPAALEMVLGAVSAPQGGTRGGILYIDPLPVLAHAGSLHRTPAMPPLDARYTDGTAFWQEPYRSLHETRDLAADIPAHFDGRRTSMLQIVARDIRSALIDANLDPEALEISIPAYCAEVNDLLEVQAQHYPRNYAEVEGRRTLYKSKAKLWAQTIASVKRVAIGEGVVGLLTADLEQIADAVDSIKAAQAFASALERDLSDSERQLVAEGDPEAFLATIRGCLADISGRRASGVVDPHQTTASAVSATTEAP